MKNYSDRLSLLFIHCVYLHYPDRNGTNKTELRINFICVCVCLQFNDEIENDESIFEFDLFTYMKLCHHHHHHHILSVTNKTNRPLVAQR